MRHVPQRTARLIVLALPVLVALATAAVAQTPTPSPTPNPTYRCAGRLTSGVRNFTTNYAELLTECEVTKLAGKACDTNLQNSLDNEIDDLNGEVASCEPAGLINLCPLEGDTPEEVQSALTGPASGSFRAALTTLATDLFKTPYAGCTRPAGVVSSNAVKCAAEIADVIGASGNTDSLEQCFFSCERARILNSGLELCVDDVLGDPIKQQVVDCKADELGNLDAIEDRCTTTTLTELGCPLGADSPAELKQALAERLATLVQEINLGIFHSDCRGSLPGEPTDPVPADVTLEPSLTKKKISCGQTIDAAFMGSDTGISFDSDLDCGPSKTATDGIIIAKSGITLNGRAGKIWSIRGPQRSSLRTGVGIRLLPGLARVTIRNFKAIESFGIGILSPPKGRRHTIVNTTVRRNIVAGLRIRSKRALLEEVTADKNGIGFDLSGDGTRVKSSSAKGSLYPPKIGIQLGGVDSDQNGKVVVVSPLNTIELNSGTGIHVLAGAHVIGQNQIRDNLLNGIEIDALANGSQIKQNTVKFNANGIVIYSDGNLVDGNLTEENLGDGYVIAGNGNVVSGNSSGKKTDRGNGGAGYRILGASTTVESNEAEANLGSGFVITGTPTLLSGNTAQENQGHGFELQSSGNTAQDCAAEANNQSGGAAHEWTFVAGQIDGDGNKAGGDTIALPSSTGFCDNDNDCPVPR